LFKGNLKTIKSSDNNSSQKNNKPEKNDVISINKTGNYKSFNEEKCKDEHSKEAGVHNGLIGDVCNKTMLLSDININIPVLKSLNKMDYDDIFLNKNEIIIGRLAVQCDFVCKNPAVGKIHAVISKRSDTKYCIKDMNSVNGTFINNKRITSNVDYYALKEGDRVALANNEYIFLLNPYNYPCHSGTS